MTNYTKTKRGFTLVEIMIVVVIIGMLAAIAIPGYQRVRKNSQDRAVTNNMRQISGAADQYFLENGVTTVGLNSLIGSSNYVRSLSTVAYEFYPDNYTQGITMTVTNVGSARTLTWGP